MEGKRRYRDLSAQAKLVQVHGRKYTTRDRLAIGTELGCPGGLAIAADIHAWAARKMSDAVAESIWTLAERLAAEMARLEEAADG
jgi:hypothetical protein